MLNVFQSNKSRCLLQIVRHIYILSIRKGWTHEWGNCFLNNASDYAEVCKGDIANMLTATNKISQIIKHIPQKSIYIIERANRSVCFFVCAMASEYYEYHVRDSIFL